MVANVLKTRQQGQEQTLRPFPRCSRGFRISDPFNPHDILFVATHALQAKEINIPDSLIEDNSRD